jgi:hypothetical protein
VMVPSDATPTSMPGVRFSYFEPQTQRYQTLESAPIPIVVGAGLTAGAGQATGGPSAGEFHDLKPDMGRLTASWHPWYGGTAMLLWQPLPLLLFLGAAWYNHRRHRLARDPRYARFAEAGHQARVGFAAARDALAGGDQQEFYAILSRTVDDYLAAKLGRPAGTVDADAAAKSAAPDAAVRRLRELNEACEHARFAPGAGNGDMQRALQLAELVVRDLERVWRRFTPA